jgi:hypothetical protein
VNNPLLEKSSDSLVDLSSQRLKKKNILFFLGLIFLFLILLGGVFYWLKTPDKENFLDKIESIVSGKKVSLSFEQQLRQDILELYTTLPGGGEEAERALERLEEAKKHDPQKMPECIVNYSILQGFVGGLVGEYYASGDSFENRNQDIFKVLAQIRDLARQNMVFNENDWIVEGIDY